MIENSQWMPSWHEAIWCLGSETNNYSPTAECFFTPQMASSCLDRAAHPTSYTHTRRHQIILYRIESHRQPLLETRSPSHWLIRIRIHHPFRQARHKLPRVLSPMEAPGPVAFHVAAMLDAPCDVLVMLALLITEKPVVIDIVWMCRENTWLMDLLRLRRDIFLILHVSFIHDFGVILE